MSYCTIAQFRVAYGDDEAIALSNLDDSAAQSINTPVLQGALDAADAVINGYLQARYTLPLTPIPPVLTRICGDIARYHLDRNVPREDVRLRYEDALKWLRDVAKGLVSLGDVAIAPTSGSAQYRTPTFSPFTGKGMEGFR